MVVAREEGQVVGFSHAGYSRHGAELYRITLRPAWWQANVAEQLLSRTEAWLRSEGYLGYGCLVHKENAAGLQFYASHAFRHLPANDEGDTLFLWKELV
jgi:GNAT superfamily N-acetyltransferase